MNAFKDDYSKGPDIHWKIIRTEVKTHLQLINDLWSCIKRSAQTSVCLGKGNYLFTDAKVCYFDKS